MKIEVCKSGLRHCTPVLYIWLNSELDFCSFVSLDVEFCRPSCRTGCIGRMLSWYMKAQDENLSVPCSRFPILDQFVRLALLFKLFCYQILALHILSLIPSCFRTTSMVGQCNKHLIITALAQVHTSLSLILS